MLRGRRYFSTTSCSLHSANGRRREGGPHSVVSRVDTQGGACTRYCTVCERELTLYLCRIKVANKLFQLALFAARLLSHGSCTVAHDRPV